MSDMHSQETGSGPTLTADATVGAAPHDEIRSPETEQAPKKPKSITFRLVGLTFTAAISPLGLWGREGEAGSTKILCEATITDNEQIGHRVLRLVVHRLALWITRA